MPKAFYKIYTKSLLLLIIFLNNISFADYVSDKPKKPILLPSFLEELNDRIALNSANIFFNQNYETRSFEAFENRFLIIHFWATWCMECLNEIINLNQLQKTFRKKALIVIAISEDFKEPSFIDQFFSKNNIDYLDIYIDKRNKIYQSLNINHLPATYLMDFNGNVIARSKPSKTIDWMDENLIRYLDDKIINVQLLPPEYKQFRDVYETPKEEKTKEAAKPKDFKQVKKSKIFIN